jgi:hypothetical protein
MTFGDCIGRLPFIFELATLWHRNSHFDLQAKNLKFRLEIQVASGKPVLGMSKLLQIAGYISPEAAHAQVRLWTEEELSKFM